MQADARRRPWTTAAFFWMYAGWAAVGAALAEPLVGALTAAFWAELGLAALLMPGRSAEDETDPLVLQIRVAAAIEGVSRSMGVPVPGVTVRETPGRLASARLLRGRPQVVISPRLVARMDDRELRGLLAHELAHLARGDLRAARLRLRLAYAFGLLLGLGAAIGLGGQSVLLLPSCAAAWFAGTLAGLILTAPLNWRREIRADADAAGLTGDPEALTRSLLMADALAGDSRSRVRPTALRWAVAPFYWRFPTHPSTSRRVGALQALAAGRAPS